LSAIAGRPTASETGSWQLREIAAGVDDLESRATVEHEKVAGWLRSWGTPAEQKAPAP